MAVGVGGSVGELAGLVQESVAGGVPAANIRTPASRQDEAPVLQSVNNGGSNQDVHMQLNALIGFGH